MLEKNKEKGLKSHTIVLMIAVALFCDALQIILSLVYMGWAVGIFAGLTFYLWFKMYGISFMKPGRLLAFTGASIIEMIPVPFLAVLPAWTGAICYLALTSKLQEIIPGADIVKLDIMKR